MKSMPTFSVVRVPHRSERFCSCSAQVEFGFSAEADPCKHFHSLIEYLTTVLYHNHPFKQRRMAQARFRRASEEIRFPLPHLTQKPLLRPRGGWRRRSHLLSNITAPLSFVTVSMPREFRTLTDCEKLRELERLEGSALLIAPTRRSSGGRRRRRCWSARGRRPPGGHRAGLRSWAASRCAGGSETGRANAPSS